MASSESAGRDYKRRETVLFFQEQPPDLRCQRFVCLHVCRARAGRSARLAGRPRDTANFRGGVDRLERERETCPTLTVPNLTSKEFTGPI